MDDHQPLVSVIIPVYNGEQYLGEAIESVLAQTYEEVELIVVDDGSTDKSAAVAKCFADVRYCFQPNGGIGAARNRGTDLARGGLLAFLDADDRWVADKLLWQTKALAGDTELAMVFGHVQQFPSPELPQTIKDSMTYTPEPMPGYSGGTMLIRRAAFDRVGRFSTGLQVGEFIEWYLRTIDLGLKSRMLPEVVLHRRLHMSNHGINKRSEKTDYARVLKAFLDRRRSTGASTDKEPASCSSNQA